MKMKSVDMVTKFLSLKIHFTVLLLEATLTHGFPDVSKVVSNGLKMKNSQTLRSPFDKSQDVIMNHENHDDGILKCLCWAELFIITENNDNKEKNLTNEFAIILESPGDIAQENLGIEGKVETYTLFDKEAKRNRVLNFTVVNETKEFTVKQHKTLHCGAGPILIKTYVEWPKRNKQKIEIRLAPTTPSKWQIYSDGTTLDYDPKKTTPLLSSPPFDTVNTESYSHTNIENVTKSTLEIEATEVTKKYSGPNKILNNENVGSKYNQSGNEVFQIDRKESVGKERILQSSSVNFSIDKNRMDDLMLGMKRELLMRNMYFKKLDKSGKIFNITEPNFADNLEYDSALYFFDLMFLNQSTSLGMLKGHHKFVIDVQVSIEHIIIEDVDGTDLETPQSITVLEEENVYRLRK